MSTTLVTAVPSKTKTAGYGATSASSPLAPFSFARREPLPQDVQIEILYCGVCHSDLHTVAMSGRAQRFRWCRDMRLLAA